MWRPFHEMNGKWFWWGDQDAESFATLWRHMHDYFTEEKHLDNLLWVFAPDDGRGLCEGCYPGSAYVDIIGIDKYGSLSDINHYNDLMVFGKPLGLSEYGRHWDQNSIPSTYSNEEIVQHLRSEYPGIVFFHVWSENWSIVENLHPESLLGNEWIITIGFEEVLGEPGQPGTPEYHGY